MKIKEHKYNFFKIQSRAIIDTIILAIAQIYLQIDNLKIKIEWHGDWGPIVSNFKIYSCMYDETIEIDLIKKSLVDFWEKYEESFKQSDNALDIQVTVKLNISKNLPDYTLKDFNNISNKYKNIFDIIWHIAKPIDKVYIKDLLEHNFIIEKNIFNTLNIETFDNTHPNFDMVEGGLRGQLKKLFKGRNIKILSIDE